MILSDSSILDAISKNDIVIEPYDRDCLGTNSYDVHLSKHLACYVDEIIDAKKHNHVEHFEIPEEGVVLKPGKPTSVPPWNIPRQDNMFPFWKVNQV